MNEKDTTSYLKLKKSINFAEYLEGKVKLEGYRLGKKMAICPFHNGPVPTMIFDMVAKTFECINCKSKGDVLAFEKRFNKHPSDEDALAALELWLEAHVKAKHEAFKAERGKGHARTVGGKVIE